MTKGLLFLAFERADKIAALSLWILRLENWWPESSGDTGEISKFTVFGNLLMDIIEVVVLAVYLGTMLEKVLFVMFLTGVEYSPGFESRFGSGDFRLVSRMVEFMRCFWLEGVRSWPLLLRSMNFEGAAACWLLRACSLARCSMRRWKEVGLPSPAADLK